MAKALGRGSTNKDLTWFKHQSAWFESKNVYINVAEVLSDKRDDFCHGLWTDVLSHTSMDESSIVGMIIVENDGTLIDILWNPMDGEWMQLREP